MQLLYRRQSGSVNGSDPFGIRCGVKQGDVLSAIIFNCVLDIAFDSWKLRLGDHGLFVAHANPRLTNTRYADDILLYAKSLAELVQMAEMLVEELADVGLHLNVKKTKILASEFQLDDSGYVDFVQISNDFVQVLHTDKYHRYLGRRHNLSSSQRSLKQQS